jgi:UDP-galactopyranose mutase
MERIVIEVEDATAKKWRMSSQQLRDKISQRINIRLAKELMTDSKEEFKQFLDEVGATMQQRGLTDDILQGILKDND